MASTEEREQQLLGELERIHAEQDALLKPLKKNVEDQQRAVQETQQKLELAQRELLNACERTTQHRGKIFVRSDRERDMIDNLKDVNTYRCPTCGLKYQEQTDGPPKILED